ncbi:transmembrane protein 98 [Nematostella vectensis]|uniref:transmembrane protein 98 n=1 Tax=Nematostella vectensis TaxID=45351 RepID=UPI001390679F|nr:transmembrane protein 98 [Nematostella vectensis]
MSSEITLIAISLLIIIFMASFVALLVVCRRKCGKLDLVNSQKDHLLGKKTVELVGAKRNAKQERRCDEDLMNSYNLYLDPGWQEDAESMVSHCVALLKACHELTERLIRYTIDSEMITSQVAMSGVVSTAKKIGPRVDDLVQAMYTPSDSALIQERSSALRKSILHLLKMIKTTSNDDRDLKWADGILLTIEREIEMLDEESRIAQGDKRVSPNRKQVLCFVNKTFDM